MSEKDTADFDEAQLSMLTEAHEIFELKDARPPSAPWTAEEVEAQIKNLKEEKKEFKAQYTKRLQVLEERMAMLEEADQDGDSPSFS